VQLLLDELLLLSKTETDETRKSAITLLSSYCVGTKADLTPHISTLLKGLISLMTEDDESILRAVAEAVSAVFKVTSLVLQSLFKYMFVIYALDQDWVNRLRLLGLTVVLNFRLRVTNFVLILI